MVHVCGHDHGSVGNGHLPSSKVPEGCGGEPPAVLGQTPGHRWTRRTRPGGPRRSAPPHPPAAPPGPRGQVRSAAVSSPVEMARSQMTPRASGDRGMEEHRGFRSGTGTRGESMVLSSFCTRTATSRREGPSPNPSDRRTASSFSPRLSVNTTRMFAHEKTRSGGRPCLAGLQDLQELVCQLSPDGRSCVVDVGDLQHTPHRALGRHLQPPRLLTPDEAPGGPTQLAGGGVHVGPRPRVESHQRDSPVSGEKLAGVGTSPPPAGPGTPFAAVGDPGRMVTSSKRRATTSSSGFVLSDQLLAQLGPQLRSREASDHTPLHADRAGAPRADRKAGVGVGRPGKAARRQEVRRDRGNGPSRFDPRGCTTSRATGARAFPRADSGMA